MRIARMMLVLAITLMLVAPGVAQEKKKKRKGGGLSPTAQTMMRMNRLRVAIEELDLTSEQEEKLGKIREELRPKMREVYGNMRDILTEEQRTAAEEAMRSVRDSGKEDAELARAVESALKLTKEQQTKMAKVNEQLVPLQKEIMKKTMGLLTPEQKEKVRAKIWPRRGKDGKKAAKKKAE